MERQKLYTQITFQGRRCSRIFETEVHKKKFLDAWKVSVEKWKEKVSVYAYCILDDKGMFLIASKENFPVNEKMETVWQKYREKLQEIGFADRSFGEVIVEKERISFLGDNDIDPDIKNAIIRMHFLPVKENYVIWPENYWWSSYMEYLGRNWMPFQIREICSRISEDERKIRKEVRRSHREWKVQNPSLYL